jgi:hypothetical protein
MPTDYLEPELTAMGEFQWELGGLRYGDITAPDPDLGLCPTVTGDEGLDDVSELLAEDTPLNGDGSVAAFGRLAPRAITLRVGYAGTDEGLAAALAALRMVISPLPNRRATRWLRWQRVGEPAKRIAVQPAVGKPLTVPGDEARLKYASAREIVIRLTAPDPVILSDVRHDEAFTAGRRSPASTPGRSRRCTRAGGKRPSRAPARSRTSTTAKACRSRQGRRSAVIAPSPQAWHPGRTADCSRSGRCFARATTTSA